MMTKSGSFLRLCCSTCVTRSINTTTCRRFTARHFGSSSTDVESDREGAEATGDEELYSAHIHTTPFQKVLLAGASAGISLAAPWRDDMIAVMGEVTGYPALRYMRGKMLADPEGRQILEKQPRINTRTVDMEYLKSLPEDTMGRHYVNFLEEQGITPDSRRPVQFVDDLELAYVMTRYRETHDLLHTLLGMPTHMLGEVSVKWVEGLQFGLPLGLTGGLFGALRLGPKHRELYWSKHLNWAWNVGRNSRFLMNIYYEKRWEQSLESLRAELNIEPPPPTPAKKAS